MKTLQKNFARLADAGNLSHAYLFFGPGNQAQEDIFSFALALANYLENKKFETPSLEKILGEVLIIKPEPLKKNISVDAIRVLSKFLYQKPIFSKKRVAIIKDSERMSGEAQNAALKITEEAPDSALIIFIVKNEDSLLAPLSSRLQKIYFAERQDDNLTSHVIPAEAGIQRSVIPAKAGIQRSVIPAKAGIQRAILNEARPSNPEADDFFGNIETIIENDQIDKFFEQLISYYQRDPIKNQKELKEIFKRLVAIKQFNTNKKLQIRSLMF